MIQIQRPGRWLGPALAILVLAAALLLATTPAQAAGPGASFTLTIYNGQSAANSVLAQVTLTCHPTGGTHPTANAACESLDQVNGVFASLPRVPGSVCVQVFAPVTVVARGTWFGTLDNFMHTYGNRCEAAVETDNVFRF